MLSEARELKPDAESVSADELRGGSVYFQDAESYRSGIRFPSSETTFIAQRQDEVAYIFE